jgi:DivIVA domain-containing protein
VGGNEPPHRAHDEGETTSAGAPAGAGRLDVRDPLPEDIRDPSFPAAVRGYDRRAVDVYVQRVNRLIAELQVSGSPPAAVRHALDRVGEQTSGILQRARETAEEITTSAREEAEDTTARAKAEARDIATAAQRQVGDAIAQARTEADAILARATDQSESMLAAARVDAEARTRQAAQDVASLHDEAEARVRSLRADIAAVSDERRTLLDEIRRVAARLEAVVAEAEQVESEMPPEAARPGGED